MEKANINIGGVDSVGVGSNMKNDGKNELDKSHIIRILDAFHATYRDVNFPIENDSLKTIRKKLSRCRKEFESNRFFVLVVGPVKSGKSTFVNILTRSNLSPTDCLECTAIPTIIGESSVPDRISCITPKRELDDTEKCELFDEIIDVIRGIEPSETLEQKTDITQLAATSDNVKNIVTLSRKENRPMIATIGIKRTEFIDDQVLLIDMPGLDGMGANEHDPLYRRMIQRADFIFFVQSSTSAINEATNEFLKWLLTNNLNSIPFRLIHNLHDSHYFLKENIRKEIVKRQLENGKKCLKETFGITGDFDSFVMNFAKIYNGLIANDNIEDNNMDDVIDCKDEYIEVERQMLASMKAQRQEIKDRNNIAKSSLQLKECVALLDGIKEKIDNRRHEMDKILSTLNGIEQPIKAIQFDYQVLRQKLVALVQHHNIKDSLERLIDSYLIQATDKMPGKTLKSSIDSMAKCFSSFSGLDRMSPCHSDVCRLITDEFTALYKKDVDALLQAFPKIGNAAGIDLSISLDFSSLPSSIVPFAPDYFDIKENVLLVLNKNYDQREQNFYFNRYKNNCKAVVDGHIDMYLNQVITAVGQIRDKFIASAISSVETERNKIVSMFERERSIMSKQEETMKEMTAVLSGN